MVLYGPLRSWPITEADVLVDGKEIKLQVHLIKGPATTGLMVDGTLQLIYGNKFKKFITLTYQPIFVVFD